MSQSFRCILKDMETINNNYPYEESNFENNTKPTSSKTILAIGGLVTIIALSAFIPASWFGVKPAVYTEKPLDLSTLSSFEEVAKDTNGDGVISWDEVVKQNLKYSSTTEEAIKDAPVDPKAIERLNDPNNLTSSFSKNLYLASVQINQSGGQIDDETQQKILTQLISQEASKVTPTTYTKKDLKVATSESKESLKMYGNNVASVLQQIITEKKIYDDMAAMDDFSKTENPDDLLMLSQNRDRVNGLLQKLISISVPPSAVQEHIIILERIALYRDTLDAFSKLKTDPIRAKLALEKYTNTMVNLMITPNQLATFFITKNIIFSAKDSGYIFTIGYTIN